MFVATIRHSLRKRVEMRVPTNASNLTYCGNFVGPQLYNPSYNTSFDDVAYNRISFYRKVNLTMLYDTGN